MKGGSEQRLLELVGRAGASPPLGTLSVCIYIYGTMSDRIPKCFYVLLFHRHLSTFHGTQLINTMMCTLYSHGSNGTREAGFAKEENDGGSVAPLSQTRQGKPGFAERWRERRASETTEHAPSNAQLHMPSSS